MARPPGLAHLQWLQPVGRLACALPPCSAATIRRPTSASDRATCRTLGVRSMILAPLRPGATPPSACSRCSPQTSARLRRWRRADAAVDGQRDRRRARQEGSRSTRATRPRRRLRTSEERMRALLRACARRRHLDRRARPASRNGTARPSGCSAGRRIETIGQPVAEPDRASRDAAARVASMVARYASAERLEDAQPARDAAGDRSRRPPAVGGGEPHRHARGRPLGVDGLRHMTSPSGASSRPSCARWRSATA